jgi:flagellar export protein FliJ
MKQFSFKLDPVLAYRKLIEDTEEQKLHAIQTAILELQKIRDDLKTKIELSSRRLQEQSCGTIDIEHIRSVSAYLEKLQAEMLRAVKGLFKLEQERVAQLSRVLEARKGREIVEKLRDNSFSEYKKETHALEQKMLDELSVTQFGRLDKQDLPGGMSPTRKS